MEASVKDISTSRAAHADAPALESAGADLLVLARVSWVSARYTLNAKPCCWLGFLGFQPWLWHSVLISDTWMLQARFIADLEKYNEWMNEEDYLLSDDDDDDDEAERGDADDTAEVSPSYFLRLLLCQPPPSLLSLPCLGPQRLTGLLNMCCRG